MNNLCHTLNSAFYLTLWKCSLSQFEQYDLYHTLNSTIHATLQTVQSMLCFEQHNLSPFGRPHFEQYNLYHILNSGPLNSTKSRPHFEQHNLCHNLNSTIYVTLWTVTFWTAESTSHFEQHNLWPFEQCNLHRTWRRTIIHAAPLTVQAVLTVNFFLLNSHWNKQRDRTFLKDFEKPFPQFSAPQPPLLPWMVFGKACVYSP